MALVKCTKEIKNHVVGQIDELFKERITKAYMLKGMTDMEIAEEVYSKLFTPDRIKVMREFTADTEDNAVLLFDNKDFVFTVKLLPIGTGDRGIERKFSIVWNKARPALAQFGSSYHPPVISSLTDPAKQAIIEASQRRRAVIEDRDTFKSGFVQAFEKVKSINELIKLWPAVIELLPAGTMDRVNRKSGPRAKEETVFDAASLNVQLLKAKVAK